MNNIHVYHTTSLSLPDENALELCARVIHKAVEALNSIYNETTLSYEDSANSIKDGILRVIQNPGETPEENHNEWMKYRESEGWVYGPTKDPEAKTHPCMVPYHALPPFQKSKDALFLAITRTFFGLEDSYGEEADEGETEDDTEFPEVEEGAHDDWDEEDFDELSDDSGSGSLGRP